MNTPTPTPWFLSEGEGDGEFLIIAHETMGCIACLEHNSFEGLNDRANGELDDRWR